MESNTIYKIAIIIVLFIFLIYIMTKTPASNSTNTTSNTPANSRPSTPINENSLTPSSPIPVTLTTTLTANSTNTIITFTVSSLTDVVNTISIPNGNVNQILMFSGNLFSMSTNNAVNIVSIQYNPSGMLSFYGYDATSEYPPAMYLLTEESLNLTINDTSINSFSPGATYEISTVSVSGNVLSFTSGSNTLTIKFPNPFQ